MVGLDFSVSFSSQCEKVAEKNPVVLQDVFFFFNHFPPRFIDSKGIRNLSLWAFQICLCVLVLFCFAEPFQIEENLNVSRRTYL